MKKYFVIAVLALVAVFAVSCNNKKIDLVGHAWNYHGDIDTMGLHFNVDITLAFNDSDSLSSTTSVSVESTAYGDSVTVMRAYTWDGEKNLVITRPDDDDAGTTRNLTYNKETEEFSMPLDQIEGETSAELIYLTGVDVVVFKKVK